VLLTFFLLKDCERIWGYLLSLIGRRGRRDADEVGARIDTALSGYVRGIALVGLVDAIVIGLALLIIGVPLVLPLMVITFFAAFVPLLGAFVAGLIAVLIALVSGGVVDALLVLAAVVLVQQIEGHLLYPLLMGRTVNLHPAVILVAHGTGGILAGVVGVFLAVPTAGIISVVIEYGRDRPPPDSPLLDDAASSAVSCRRRGGKALSMSRCRIRGLHDARGERRGDRRAQFGGVLGEASLSEWLVVWCCQRTVRRLRS
jgi:predicted PurR-regulated permease PerM